MRLTGVGLGRTQTGARGLAGNSVSQTIPCFCARAAELTTIHCPCRGSRRDPPGLPRHLVLLLDCSSRCGTQQYHGAGTGLWDYRSRSAFLSRQGYLGSRVRPCTLPEPRDCDRRADEAFCRHVIWAADTNFRIGLSNDEVRSLAERDEYDALWAADQVSGPERWSLDFA